MKKSFLSGIIVITLVCLLMGCKNKNTHKETQEAIVLNEQTAVEFANALVESVYNGNPAPMNEAVNQAFVKERVSENSIVYSGFDVEGGQKYFENCLHIGDAAVQTVNDGGVFHFVRYYQREGEHHIVFSSYNDFVVNFADYHIDTMAGKIRIKDGFIYNTGKLLSTNVEFGMLYNLLLQTNPESEAKWLQLAEQQTRDGRHAQALATLKAHRDELQAYPLYYQLYIANLYQTEPKTFDKHLDALKEELDVRYLLLHKLLYYANAGNPDKAEQVINALIEHTGDDPIYLFMYARAAMVAGRYQDALTCLQTVADSSPLFWDLWASEMQCRAKLKDATGYQQCLRRGKELFGLSDQEIREMGFQM